jgi:hypothetical protein
VGFSFSTSRLSMKRRALRPLIFSIQRLENADTEGAAFTRSSGLDTPPTSGHDSRDSNAELNLRAPLRRTDRRKGCDAMKRVSRVATVLAGLAVVGCQNMSNTEKGAGLGGALGAGMGAAIGSANGDAGKGALIGAAGGALLGGMAGNAEDKAEKADLQYQRNAAYAAAAKPTLGLTDVAGMAQQGMSDQIIINQIRTTGSTYALSPNDLAYLKQNNVSDPVIMEMQRASSRRVIAAPPPQTVIVEQPVMVGRPVYVAPPPVVGFGVSYHHHRR